MTTDIPARVSPEKMLRFGTAGLRGIMSEEPGGMNTAAVAMASQGFARVILEEGLEAAGVVIAYDSRANSEEFARSAACVFAANGVHVRLFDALRPTPELSFAIRHFGAAGGVNITASHNPAEYNGYKAYWADGAQLGVELTERVSAAMHESPGRTRSMDYDAALAAGMIELIDSGTDELFLSACLAAAPASAAICAEDFAVVYSPLHGAGASLVPPALRRAGLRNLVCVEEQLQPDGSFPTVEKPNPEEEAAFALAQEYGRRCGAQLLIATDPDADRIGVMTRHGEEYHRLSGNELGALMTEYLLRKRQEHGGIPEGSVVVKSLVTTPLAAKIAAAYGIGTENTVTGFRFMAERIAAIAPAGVQPVISFEESCGYMVGDHVRDKDAVTAAVIVAGMAAEYHKRGMSLVDALRALYLRFGWHMERTISLALEDEAAAEAARGRIRQLSLQPPCEIGGIAVTRVRDFSRGLNAEGVHGRDDMLCFELEGGGSYVMRPSGTEPKLKIYLMAEALTEPECTEKFAALKRVKLL